jgi:toxin ParE1/3/4
VRLELAEEANRDLHAIYLYCKETWGSARARTYVQDIKAHFRQLAQSEVSGTKADDIAPGLRRLVSGSHVIWFRVEGEVLRVIRVLHGSRDAGRWV